MASFLASQQGGQKLEFDGHLYIKKRVRGQNVYWRCDQNKSARCYGGAKTVGVLLTEGMPVELGQPHNHAPSPSRCAAARLARSVHRTAITARGDDARTIVNEVLAGASDDVLAAMPKIESLQKAVQRKRRALQNYTISTAKIPAKLRKMEKAMATFHASPSQYGDVKLEFGDQISDTNGMATFHASPSQQGDVKLEFDDQIPNTNGMATFHASPSPQDQGGVKLEPDDHVFNTNGMATFHASPSQQGDLNLEFDGQISNTRGIATFHTSQQGGVKLEFGGHLYIKNRQRGSVIHWRCDRNKSDRCLGTARTDGMEEGVSVVELGKAHNHAPSPDRCAVARLKARVRAAALDARENAPQTVVDEILAEATEDMIAALPKKESMVRAVVRKRQKDTHVIIPSLVPGLLEFAKTMSGTSPI